jgi:DNA-binding LacI/PurR family transcriptional regulator
MHRPPPTTVAVGAREIGEEAARLLLRGIKSPKGPSESIILPPKLVFRSSCGARPAI